MLFNHFLYAFAAAMIALQFVANNFSGVQAARPLRIVGNEEDMNSIFQDVESSQKKLARDHPKSAFMNSVNTPEREQRCTVRVQTVKTQAGKCVRLQGGNMGCQSKQYLDLSNVDCME